MLRYIDAAPAIAGHFPPSRSFFYYRPENFLYRQYGPFCGYFPFSCRQPTVTVIPLLWPRYRIRRPLARAVVSSTGMRIITAISQVVFDGVPPPVLVYVDCRLMGSARSFGSEETSCPLNEGVHVLRVEVFGYQSCEADLETTPGLTIRIDISLERGASKQSEEVQETASGF